jgi:hypothetical protein
MVRARLAFLSLASSLLLTSGCTSTSMCENECHSGWFSRFRLASRTSAPACECEGGMPVSRDGTMVVPPNAFVPPSGFAAPPPALITNPAPGAVQPPRIIPQAQPVPYTGQ